MYLNQKVDQSKDKAMSCMDLFDIWNTFVLFIMLNYVICQPKAKIPWTTSDRTNLSSR